MGLYNVHSYPAEDKLSYPLILTPYLNISDIEKARELSRVTPEIENVTSYSGFFTVNENKTCGSNLFFWFFPAEKNWIESPVLLWLQGGPGSTSMFGLFGLVGPFNSLPEGLTKRNTSWTKFANLLFIDNPVGAGFSFTTNNCYPRSIPEVAEQLFSALIQFFKLFPELQGNRFFLTGESFAGHYIPVLGALIDRKNKINEIKINLKGLIMGNPFIKLDCHDYGSFLYQMGMADETLRDEIYEAQYDLKKYVKEKNYTAAYIEWDYIMIDLIYRTIGLPSTHSILTESADSSTFISFLNTTKIRNKIHVGQQEFSDFNEDAFDNLVDTIAQPFISEIEQLLRTKKYIIGIYSGNLDIKCMYTSALCVMRSLKWPGRYKYLKASRHTWYIKDQLVGWYKTANNLLLDIVVKDAQHAAVLSKPSVTHLMMQSIVSAVSGQNPLWALQTCAS